MGLRLVASCDDATDIPVTNGTIDQAGLTVLQVTAPANTGITVRGFGISFDGIDGSEEPIRVKIARQTTAGTGGVAGFIGKLNNEDGRTTQSTVLQDIDTTSPTDGDILRKYFVPVRGGGFHRNFGEHDKIEVGPGDRIAIICVTQATQTDLVVYPEFIFEE